LLWRVLASICLAHCENMFDCIELCLCLLCCVVVLCCVVLCCALLCCVVLCCVVLCCVVLCCVVVLGGAETEGGAVLDPPYMSSVNQL